ncbi:hypothetical protein NHQ30_004470 [Ciborinia camelliae]|nr:hypothetical protein NHQ30_004470 [Ciborinia camelliae]
MNTSSQTWLTPRRARTYRCARRSEDRGTFWLFEFFPQEVQLMILKYASPSPRLVHFKFNSEFSPRADDNLMLCLKVLPDPDLFSLLNTCKTFNMEIRREYKKITVQPFGTDSDTQLVKALKENEPGWEVTQSINLKMRGVKRPSLSHVYLHPTLDTLLMNFRELFLLYLLGGSVDMSSVRHLALYNIADHAWDYSWLEFKDKEVKILMYGMLSLQCPALQKLSLVLRYQDQSALYQPLKKIEDDEVIFDIPDDFVDMDFEDKNGKPVSAFPPAMLQIGGQAKSIKSHFQQCLPRPDPEKYGLDQGSDSDSESEKKLDEAAVNFWKTHTAPVPGLIGRLDRDESWREKGKQRAEPRLFLRDVKAYIPVNIDGTMFHTKKGLVKFFDVAPW